ncbi:MAG: HPr family phosphocarrier protein, partial [Desulfobacterales bacterium]
MQKSQPVGEITFDAKVRIFSHDYLKCCVYISSLDDPQKAFTKKLFSKLIYSSLLLEDFLDFHGAKNNKDWYYYRELSAAVRHLSLGANFQKHISNRLVFYDLPEYGDFQKEGDITLEFLTSTLLQMAPAIIDEARLHNIPIPEEGFSSVDFPNVATDELLPYDIDDQDKDLQKKNIVKIASEFLNITKDLEQLKFYEPYTYENILTVVPDKVNEVEIRRYEMLLHSLQSSFD